MVSRALWASWGVLTVGLAGWLGHSLVGSDADRRIFLPGQTTVGHYQIELRCDACHAESFSAVSSNACLKCHGAELKTAKDSHPATKFDDPRNAQLLQVLNARDCVTCHREHDPHETGEMGVTLPADYCWQCHKEIGKERPSHKGYGFSTCASAGCHNYHDNRALYEDFLVAHLNEKDLRDEQRLPARFAAAQAADGKPVKALARNDADAPVKSPAHDKIHDEWAATAHARGGVNCTQCHGTGNQWKDKPGQASCQGCHGTETQSFKEGRHGMRLAVDLPPMSPGEARQPMKAGAHGRSLNCSSCHSAHRYDTQSAASNACLQCHNDSHSLAYESSPHARLWTKEVAGEAPKGSGVSCASCHMPRLHGHDQNDVQRIIVQHNQNDNLRPNEKMIRSVCIQCHGLGFALDSLADKDLIRRNFTGRPATKVESLDLVQRRLNEKRNHARKEP